MRKERDIPQGVSLSLFTPKTPQMAENDVKNTQNTQGCVFCVIHYQPHLGLSGMHNGAVFITQVHLHK